MISPSGFSWIIGIPLIALFAAVGLAIVVIPSTRGEPGRPTLNLLLLLIILWTFSSVMVHSISLPDTRFWMYLLLIFGTFTGAVGVHFSVQFAGYNGWKAKWIVRLYYAMPIMVTSLLISGQILVGAILLSDGSVDIQWGPMAPFLWGGAGFGILLAIGFLLGSLCSFSMPDKRRILFPLLGFMIMCLGALSNFIASAYPVDVAANFIFVSMISYGVVGRHMLRPTIKLPLSRTIPLSCFLLILCYAAIFTFSRVWIGYTLVNANIVAGLTSLTFGTVMFGPSRTLLLNQLAKYLFPYTYRYQKALAKLASLDNSLIHWEKNAIGALNIIAEATRALGTVLLLNNEKTRYFEAAYTTGNEVLNISQIKLPIDSPLVKYLAKNGGTLSNEDIEQYLNTRVVVRGEDDTLSEVGSTLYCAIQSDSGPKAILVVMWSLREGWRENEARDFLILACHQIATNTINAELYKESQREIMKRKRVEATLNESELKYSTLVEQASDGVIVIQDSILKFVNKAYTRIVGYSTKELLGMPFMNLVPPEYRDQVANQYGKQLEGKPSHSPYLPKVLCKDGTQKDVEYSFVTINYTGGLAVMGFVRDITKRKQTEEEQQKIEKLESVGTLAGGIAHDFNNLLTGITGNISLAKRHLQAGDKAFERLEEAEKASVRARDLTQQLLTFARGSMPVKKLTSVSASIRETAEFALTGSNTGLEFSLPDDLWAAEIDEGQISQVIHNIVINASEAMPAGGILRISASNMVIKRLGALPLPRGNYLRIDIKDEGIGMSKEQAARIFEPYYTTKQKGSGLGLATAYSIIKNHGGYITAESRQNAGTTFKIYLPASEEQLPVVEEAKEEMRITGQGKILVMDDEEIIRDMLSMMLPVSGYQVELTSDGAEAIKKYVEARESGQPFDAVIMDLTIPGGMGGKEAIKKLLEIDPDARVIVSSGYTTDPIMSDYKKYGFSAIITKPYSVTQVEETLHSVLGRKKK
ncbi:PAS domain S-box protein [Chloroflexota bacterium]